MVMLMQLQQLQELQELQLRIPFTARKRHETTKVSAKVHIFQLSFGHGKPLTCHRNLAGINRAPQLSRRPQRSNMPKIDLGRDLSR